MQSVTLTIVELAMRRVADRTEQQTPYNIDVVKALRDVADEVAKITAEAPKALLADNK